MYYILNSTSATLYRKSDLCIPRNKTAWPDTVSVSDLYVPRIGLPIWLQQNRQIWEYINRSQIHECGNWETAHYNFFGYNEAVQFHFWECKNRNQTRISMDSHRPYICSAQRTLIRSMFNKWLFDMAFFWYVFWSMVCKCCSLVVKIHAPFTTVCTLSLYGMCT